MEYLTFQEEKDIILWSLINDVFGKTFSTRKKGERSEKNSINLELYITPQCNQSCSYCYLCKYGDKLYPPEIRNQENILKNLEIMLNYCIEHKWNPHRFDLFTGEIWDTDFGYSVYEITKKAVEKGFRPDVIVIPTNMSFLLSDKSTEKAEDFLSYCKNFSVKVCYSCSNDGLYLDLKTRPLNNPESYQYQKGTEEYYDKLFKFCKKWELGFHPMVAAHGIEDWIENYKWWEESLKKYDFIEHPIMYLEVRNDDWTEEKIKSYLKYLNFVIDYEIKNTYNNNVEEFSNFVYRVDKDYRQGTNYSPMHINRNEFDPGCTIHRSLVVRLGDMAIVPCHRTSYDEFIGGHFKIENNKIVGVTAKNIQILNQVWLNNMAGNAKCGTCKHRSYCIKGCYGSQFESTGELLYPIESVCEFLKAKNFFLYLKYDKIGILDTHRDGADFKKAMQEEENTEEFKKWKEIIQKII